MASAIRSPKVRVVGKNDSKVRRKKYPSVQPFIYSPVKLLKFTFVGEGIPGGKAGKADIFKFDAIKSVQNCEIFVHIRLMSKLQFKQGNLQGRH